MGRDLGRAGTLARQAPRRRSPRRGGGGRPPGLRRGLALTLALLGALVAWQMLRGNPPSEPDPVEQALAPDTDLPDDLGLDDAVELAESTEPGERLADVIVAEGPGPVLREGQTRFGPPDPFQRIDVSLQRGETLFQSLLRGGVPRNESARIVSALTGQVDFGALRPGDRFTGTLWLDEELIEGAFRSGRRARWRIRPQDGRLVAVEAPLTIERVTEVVRGEVESSLFAAIYAAGERPNLIMSFVDMFRWDFDFGMQTRQGDRFEMLVEKEFLEGTFYGYGPILAARYESGSTTLEACWFDSGEEQGLRGHFHRDGNSVRRAFLRAPLEFTRISSRFTHARRHPVLGYTRPHRGVDYAAPTGTPVYAVADGVVLDAGRMGGAGLAVRIRHPNGWITSYSHLSRILVRKGQRVSQSQLIGRVGSTGYSTGPHLDYRIRIGGQFVDPLKVEFPKGDPVPRNLRARFTDQCDAAFARLEAVAPGSTVVRRNN